ncbi:MAG TPA: CHRD domain-containing protein [Puia sp.]|jgi:hypothetical protein
MKKTFLPGNFVPFIPALLLCIILALFVSCGKKNSSDNGNNPSDNITYIGTFMKTDSTTTTATGTFTGVFNKSTLQMTYSFTWHALSSQPIAMHFHDNGPVIIAITGFPVATDQTMTGTATFSTIQAEDLASGFIFVMIHTTDYPGGEIMAPIVKQ